MRSNQLSGGLLEAHAAGDRRIESKWTELRAWEMTPLTHITTFFEALSLNP